MNANEADAGTKDLVELINLLTNILTTKPLQGLVEQVSTSVERLAISG
jgi:hypothetical protein